MRNPYFQFKQFTVLQDQCAMKVTTDACLFGAWIADDLLQRKAMRGRLLDIGAGTGLLSLMVAQKGAGNIDAVEIDVTAAAQAAANFNASPWKGRLTTIQADVKEWQPQTEYDVIFSNPPFYQNELKSPVAPKNLAHHDAGLTLPQLIRFIGQHLSCEGLFYLLLPVKREKDLNSLLAENGLFSERIVRVQQTLKHLPFRLMIQGRRKRVMQVEEAVMSIKNEANVYTASFTALLKDYYLYL